MKEYFKDVSKEQINKLEEDAYIYKNALSFDEKKLTPDSSSKNDDGIVFNELPTETDHAITFNRDERIKTIEKILSKKKLINEIDEKYNKEQKRLELIKKIQNDLSQLNQNIETIEEDLKLTPKTPENKEKIRNGSMILEGYKQKRNSTKEELEELMSDLDSQELN